MTKEKEDIKRAPTMVLLVDDQAIIGEALRRALANEPDIDFHFCSNAPDAVSTAVRIRPTIILQDLVMPDCDGMDLLRQYRSKPEIASVPVVVLSVREDPVVKSEAFVAGANDYLVKLPDRVELLARIRYHSRGYLAQLQRDEAMRALRESQQQLLDSNTALLSLNQKLEAATKAKSDFLAMMSHEVRTPLNALLGFSDLLMDTPLNKEQEDYLETVRASGRVLLTVINDILDFSKIEAGKMDIESVPFDLSRCVREACELFQPKAVEQFTKLTWEITDGVNPMVKGDVTRLRQILTNLVSNAVKFTKNGGVAVTARLATDNEVEARLPNRRPDLVYLCLSVRDTGVGIPEDRRDKLFQSFSQAEASTTRKFGGTGLGLAICRRLSELMGGTIWYETPPDGGGSLFTVLLGFGAGEDDIRSPDEMREEASDRERLAELLRGAKVLVAEDNPLNVKLLVTLLKQEGIEPTVAADGIQAIEGYKEHKPDLIFMDVQMPHMDGLQATRTVRELERNQDPNEKHEAYVIALTAEAMEGDEAKCLAAGMNDYLPKPLKRNQFRSALRRFAALAKRED